MAKKPLTQTKKTETAKKPKTYLNDIREVMRNIDMCNLHYYDSLPDEQKKGISPFILLRFASLASNESKCAEHCLMTVNNFVNVGFELLAKYPDLQWKQLAACGVGKVIYHPWIKAPTRVTTSLLDSLLLRISPSLNTMELKLAKKKLTESKLIQFCRDFAMEDSEIKPIIQEYKKFKDGIPAKQI